MTRRTKRPDFSEHLTPVARKQHVQQMGEVRSYLIQRSMHLYPLCPERKAFSKLISDIDAHVEHWTGNPEFFHSGHQTHQWYINDN